MVGLLGAAALVLLAAGAPKILRPGLGGAALTAARLPWARHLRPTWVVRLTGLAEVAVALSVIAFGGRPAAAAVLVTFVVLAAFARRMMTVAPGQGCGCFGQAVSPVGPWHVGTNLALAAVGAAATLSPPPSLAVALGSQPWAGVPLLALTALLAYLTYLLMTALPSMLDAAAGRAVAR